MLELLDDIGQGILAFNPNLYVMYKCDNVVLIKKKQDMLDEISGDMNVIHRALLTWSFHRALEGFKIDDYTHPELYENTEGLVSSVRCVETI